MVRLVIATVVTVLALAGPTAAASTDVVAAGFVAVTTGSGSMQISAFRLDGSAERRLTAGPADHHYPSLSPDGTQLLYTGDEGGRDEVYTLTVARPTVATRITSPPGVADSGSWSPDGRSITYSALLPGASAYQIFIAGTDGSHPVQLTHTADSGNTQPVYSPDGARIAYISGETATHPGPNGSTVTGIENRIWVMAVDGSGAAPLSTGPLDAYPAWLDSNTILFARSSFLSQSSQIVSAGLDGHVQVLSPPGQYYVEPKPMPGGKSYGATQEIGTELHLVKISRADGAALANPGAGEFLIDRLPIPAADGSTFSVAWIVTPAQPHAPSSPTSLPPALITLVMVASIALAAGAAALAYRQLRT